MMLKRIVEKSVTIPSQAFGELVLEVDHKFIGERMKADRLYRGVRAMDVAKKLSVSKTLVNFLENGKRSWTLELM